MVWFSAGGLQAHALYFRSWLAVLFCENIDYWLLKMTGGNVLNRPKTVSTPLIVVCVLECTRVLVTFIVVV